MFPAHQLPDRIDPKVYVLPITVETDDVLRYGPVFNAVIAGDGTVLLIGVDLEIVGELAPSTFVRFVDVAYVPSYTDQ